MNMFSDHDWNTLQTPPWTGVNCVTHHLKIQQHFIFGSTRLISKMLWQQINRKKTMLNSNNLKSIEYIQITNHKIFAHLRPTSKKWYHVLIWIKYYTVKRIWKQKYRSICYGTFFGTEWKNSQNWERERKKEDKNLYFIKFNYSVKLQTLFIGRYGYCTQICFSFIRKSWFAWTVINKTNRNDNNNNNKIDVNAFACVHESAQRTLYRIVNFTLSPFTTLNVIIVFSVSRHFLGVEKTSIAVDCKKEHEIHFVLVNVIISISNYSLHEFDVPSEMCAPIW